MVYNNDQHFGRSQLLLEPEEASFFDLILLLFSSDIKKRKFVDCNEEQRWQNFGSRWIMFISVLAQKVLLILRKPMASLGHTVEMLLNLLSSNGGLFGLLQKILTGRPVVKPDPASATFISVVGNLDTRVEMDKNIKAGDPKYTAFLAFMAAKFAYENESFVRNVITNLWKMEFKGFYEFWNGYQNQASTAAFMMTDTKADPNLIVVAFRGTEPFGADGWISDVDVSWYGLEGVGQIHRGFMKALGLQKTGWPKDINQLKQHSYAYYTFRKMLKDILKKNKKAKFIVTGHSLGGALAILFVSVLAFHEETDLLQRMEGVYTFGQPRVGDEQFEKYMEAKIKEHNMRYYRYVYSNDVVPRVPFDNKFFMYKHFGPCQFYNSIYKGKVLPEEPNKNYFALLWFIIKRIIAAWELIRSFILPVVKGKDYKETWLMISVRIFGLLFPGLPAHCPQDYDNSVRLGSLGSSMELHDSPQELHQNESKDDYICLNMTLLSEK